MKILKLEYKVAGLGSRKFDFTQDSNCIVIRGKNYSGKTVLLNLLSPKAIDKNYLFNSEVAGVFSEKLISIEKDGSIFELYSRVISSGINCSFKVNGEEKCGNGKVTTYNDLLIQYDLDSVIDIIDQNSSYFFDLSPIERKKYIQENYINDHALIEKWREYVNKRTNGLSSKIIDILNFRTNTNSVALGKEAETLNSLNVLNKIFEDELLILNAKLMELNKSFKAIPPPLNLAERYSPEYIAECDSINSEALQLEEKSLEKDLYQLENEKSIAVKICELNTKLKDTENVSCREEDINLLKEIVAIIVNMNSTAKLLLDADKPKFSSEFHEAQILKINSGIEELNKELNTLTNKKSFIVGKIQSNDDMIAKGKDNPCVKEECLAMLKNENAELVKSISVVEEDIIRITNAINSLKTKLLNGTAVAKEDALKQQRLHFLENKHKELCEIKHNLLFTLTNEQRYIENLIETNSMDFVTKEIDRNQIVFQIEKENKSIMEKINVLRDTRQTNLDTEQLEENINTTKLRINDIDNLIIDSLILEENRKQTEKYQNNLKEKDNIVLIQNKIEDIKTNKLISVDKDRIEAINFNLRKILLETEEEKIIKEELDSLLKLKDILNVNGLPKILIQGELIKLENLINININKYFTNDIKLNFDYTDKKLDINIKTKHSPSNTYEKLSGAEKSIVKICCSLAFQQENMSIVRLDEIDAFFDEDNRLSFSGFLDNLANNSDQLFCISHNQELLDNKKFININLSKE